MDCSNALIGLEKILCLTQQQPQTEHQKSISIQTTALIFIKLNNNILLKKGSWWPPLCEFSLLSSIIFRII